MTKRNIVKIDQQKCNGCGECVTACAEGAIKIIDGKAKLISESYCDGLGACLGHCPQDAIAIEQREAPEFDQQAVEEHLSSEKKHDEKDMSEKLKSFTCPGLAPRQFNNAEQNTKTGNVNSQLRQWPVQLKLLSPSAPYFKKADLLVAADCVAFAMGDFHSKMLTNKTLAVGCPTLDNAEEYVSKLCQIIKTNDLNSLTVVHMKVPCCTGLTNIVKKAIIACGSEMKFNDVTIDLDGRILESRKIDVSMEPA
jgi:ferredoxin